MAGAPVSVTYAAEDEETARTVLARLATTGIDAAGAALARRSAIPPEAPVLVLWSQNAETIRGSLWRTLRGRRRVVIARLDASRPPVTPGAVAINLQRWRGRPDHRGWQALTTALGGGSSRPAAAPAAKPPAKAKGGLGLALGFGVAGVICAAAVAIAVLFG